MDDSLNKIVLNLLEATVALYPADSTGAPVTGNLPAGLWTGARAEGLKATERWVTIETRPTGAKYPGKHPLAPQYDISIDRVWALELADLIGFQAGWTNYVLDVLWVEEETQRWHRRTFYGVTISERSLESRGIEAGFTDDHRFAAQYFTADSGSPSAPPGATPSAPLPLYQVFYRSNLVSAPLLLYTYDAASHTFTAVGDPTSRAVITFTAGVLTVTFAGDASPVLSTGVGESYQKVSPYQNALYYQRGNFMVRGGIVAGQPLPFDLPRLDFCYGPNLGMRVCTLTRNGLFATQFVETNPALADGLFGIYGGTQLQATLGVEVDAKAFVVI